MPITHVNSQMGTPATGGSPGLTSTSVVTKPTGLAVGDLMVAVVHGNKAGFTAPSVRWTRQITQDAGGTLYRMEVWYCVATSSETAATNFTWTDADAASPMHAAISAYRGVDQTNPINTSGINTGVSTNPQSGPSVTTTYKSFILSIRSARFSASPYAAYSSSATERWDGGNNSTVGYSATLHDGNTEVASGSISGLAITASTNTNMSDTFSVTLALRSADVTASPGSAAATVAALAPTVAIGAAGAAGKASVTATAFAPASVLTGQLAFPGKAAAVAALPDVGRTPRPSVAAATAAASSQGLFFGTPHFRQLVVPYENRVIVVGQD